MILWNYFRSSASWRVRTALNIKKIDFQYIAIDLLKGDQVLINNIKTYDDFHFFKWANGKHVKDQATN